MGTVEGEPPLKHLCVRRCGWWMVGHAEKPARCPRCRARIETAWDTGEITGPDGIIRVERPGRAADLARREAKHLEKRRLYERRLVREIPMCPECKGTQTTNNRFRCWCKACGARWPLPTKAAG